jgi:hypothetical protein
VAAAAAPMVSQAMQEAQAQASPFCQRCRGFVWRPPRCAPATPRCPGPRWPAGTPAAAQQWPQRLQKHREHGPGTQQQDTILPANFPPKNSPPPGCWVPGVPQHGTIAARAARFTVQPICCMCMLGGCTHLGQLGEAAPALHHLGQVQPVGAHKVVLQRHDACSRGGHDISQ